MAQASHAANALVQEHGANAVVRKWQAETPQGFGTTIVLAANKMKIESFFKQPLIERMTTKGWVIDPDYAISMSSELLPFINHERVKRDQGKLEQHPEDPNRYILHRKEATCAYILGSKEYLAPFLGEWPLY